ncbi:MAG: site-2 protease family protein [Eubacterium sp.]
MRFYINNVSIKIEFSFFLIISFSILTDSESVLYVILFSALHELGHIVMLYVLGGRAESITIACYGIGLKHKSKLNDFRQILFLLGGVTVNFIFVLLNIEREINLALFAVNILPLYPLDGGRVLKLVLNNLLTINISDKVFKIISIIIIAFLIAAAVYFKNLSLTLIVIYIIIYSLNNSFD